MLIVDLLFHHSSEDIWDLKKHLQLVRSTPELLTESVRNVLKTNTNLIEEKLIDIEEEFKEAY